MGKGEGMKRYYFHVLATAVVLGLTMSAPVAAKVKPSGHQQCASD